MPGTGKGEIEMRDIAKLLDALRITCNILIDLSEGRLEVQKGQRELRAIINSVEKIIAEAKED